MAARSHLGGSRHRRKANSIADLDLDFLSQLDEDIFEEFGEDFDDGDFPLFASRSQQAAIPLSFLNPASQNQPIEDLLRPPTPAARFIATQSPLPRKPAPRSPVSEQNEDQSNLDPRTPARILKRPAIPEQQVDSRQNNRLQNREFQLQRENVADETEKNRLGENLRFGATDDLPLAQAPIYTITQQPLQRQYQFKTDRYATEPRQFNSQPEQRSRHEGYASSYNEREPQQQAQQRPNSETYVAGPQGQQPYNRRPAQEQPPTNARYGSRATQQSYARPAQQPPVNVQHVPQSKPYNRPAARDQYNNDQRPTTTSAPSKAPYATPQPRTRSPCSTRCRLIQCPAGPPGLQGRPGRNGRPGADGQAGTEGLAAPDMVPVMIDPPCITCPAGLLGKRGSVGDVGFDGQMGEMGRHGVPGRPGMTGGMGGKGAPGSAGEKGKPGPKGIPGLDLLGGKGQPGRKGNQGTQGAAGLPGESGQSYYHPGPPGPRGPPGKKGLQGLNGIPGLRGPNGERGFVGKDAVFCPCPQREMRPFYQSPEGEVYLTRK